MIASASVPPSEYHHILQAWRPRHKTRLPEDEYKWEMGEERARALESRGWTIRLMAFPVLGA